MAMTNKQLKELLNQYPDEAIIYIYESGYDNDCRHTKSVDVKYIDCDNYEVPDIVLD